MIFEEAGKPARIQTAPKFVLRAMGLFNPPLREMIEMLYEFEEPFVVDHSDFERAFGMTRHTLEAGHRGDGPLVSARLNILRSRR